MLRALAANRGCKLVKSRRRTPGSGDYGRYGLKDAGSGAEVFGFGTSGLTASPEDIEQFLRGKAAATWKKSIGAAAAGPAPAPGRAAKPEPQSKPQRAPPPPPPPKPKPPVVREAARGDAPAIAALVTGLGFESSEQEIAKRLAALRKAGEPPLVADRDGVVGCLTWHVTPVLHRPRPVGRVTMLVVAEPARKHGIGRLLMEAAEARLAKLGCGLVEVTSNIELGGAHDFYRHLGYEPTSYRFARKLA